MTAAREVIVVTGAASGIGEELAVQLTRDWDGREQRSSGAPI